jgi:lipopolysaccharide/colanic/teichoic acid biosynthesis glycosyltransferase
VLRVKPGITSPATVLHRHEEEMLTGPDWEETYRTEILPAKLRIELDYLSRRTLSKDMLILAQTAFALFMKPARLVANRGSQCRS